MCKDVSLESLKNLMEKLVKQKEKCEEERLTNNYKEAILCFQLCL